MRHCIFLDKKINKLEFENWKKEDTAFWQKFANITPFYWTIDYDFSTYPVEPDWDGDARPTEAFMKELTEKVYKNYGEDGTDFVMLFVHEDNWRSSGKLFEAFKKEFNIKKEKGIWGLALAYKYKNYLSVYARWDEAQAVNTFATIYHERFHALDALIKTEINVDVNPIIGVKSWDSGCVHGGEKPWQYIRNRENTEAIVLIAPYLREALKKRQDRHDAYIKGMKQTLLGLAQKMLYLLRLKLNKKDGINN